MSAIDLLIILAIGLAIILPTEPVIRWMYEHSRATHSRLNTPKNPIYFSKSGLIFGLSKFLTFVKGFAIPTLIHSLWENDLAILISIFSLTLFQLWLPDSRHKPSQIGLLLWGISSYFNPFFIILFPILVLLICFLIDSWAWSITLTLALELIIITFTNDTDPIALLGLGTATAITVITWLPLLFSESTEPHLITTLFKHRNKSN